jgi:hypothetical protein
MTSGKIQSVSLDKISTMFVAYSTATNDSTEVADIGRLLFRSTCQLELWRRERKCGAHELSVL